MPRKECIGSESVGKQLKSLVPGANHIGVIIPLISQDRLECGK
jgi:hypothetical protein